jgi:hypothetical protein
MSTSSGFGAWFSAKVSTYLCCGRLNGDVPHYCGCVDRHVTANVTQVVVSHAGQPAGHVTYRLTATLEGAASNIYSLVGSSGSPRVLCLRLLFWRLICCFSHGASAKLTHSAPSPVCSYFAASMALGQDQRGRGRDRSRAVPIRAERALRLLADGRADGW